MAYESRTIRKKFKIITCFSGKSFFATKTQRHKPAGCRQGFTKGTWKAEFTEGILDSTDIVIEGRYGFDACKGSNLEKKLIDNKIKTVLVCGFTTDHCVKETMNSTELMKYFDTNNYI